MTRVTNGSMLTAVLLKTYTCPVPHGAVESDEEAAVVARHLAVRDVLAEYLLEEEPVLLDLLDGEVEGGAEVLELLDERGVLPSKTGTPLEEQFTRDVNS